MALQGHRVGELRRDRQQGQHIAVAQRLLQAGGVDLELLDEARRLGLGVVDALELHAVRIRQHRGPAGVAQHLAQRLLRAAQFVDGRRVDGTRQRHPRARRLKHQHIAGHQLQVFRLVALDQEIVDIQLGHHAPLAAQRELAHRAVQRRAAGRHHGRQQRRLAGQGVDAGALRRPDHEHRHAAQLAQGHVEGEVGVQAADLCAQVPLEFRRFHASHVEAAHLGQADLAIAVDRAAVVDIDRTPGPNHQFVARADAVVGRHRHVAQPAGPVGRFGEEVAAKDRQQAAGGRFDELLEFAGKRCGLVGAAKRGLGLRVIAGCAGSLRQPHTVRVLLLRAGACGARVRRAAVGGAAGWPLRIGRQVARRSEGAARHGFIRSAGERAAQAQGE